MKERFAKWLIKTGARLLGRGYIVTLRGDIAIPAGSFSVITTGGGGGGGNALGGNPRSDAASSGNK